MIFLWRTNATSLTTSCTGSHSLLVDSPHVLNCSIVSVRHPRGPFVLCSHKAAWVLCIFLHVFSNVLPLNIVTMQLQRDFLSKNQDTPHSLVPNAYKTATVASTVFETCRTLPLWILTCHWTWPNHEALVIVLGNLYSSTPGENDEKRFLC